MKSQFNKKSICKEWYDNNQMDDLLKYYIKTDKCDVGAVIANEEMLKDVIVKIDFNSCDQIVFPLHVNVLTREFATNEMPANHWVGILIIQNKKNQKVIVNYLDSIGKSISNQIASSIIKIFANCNIIERFNSKNKIQYLEKNDYDCGPFLIYAFKALQEEKILLPIANVTESLKLGQYLREIFKKKETLNFDLLQKHIIDEVINPLPNFEKILVPYNNYETELPSIKKIKIDQKTKIRIEKILKDSSLTEIRKINQIGQIRKEKTKELSKALKILVNAKNSEELLKLIDLFNKLTDFNIEIGKLGHQDNINIDTSKYYTDAAMCCQYILNIIKQVQSKENKVKIAPLELQKIQENSYKKLLEIQKLILEAAGVKPKEDITEENINEISGKNLLKQLRDYVKKQDLTSYEKIPQIYNNIVNGVKTDNVPILGMKDYLTLMHKQAEEMIGKPPCEYAVIGLGSMALGQMTPWSDLEFAILTENDNYKQSEDLKIKNYFKNLSHYVHFKVINLGEIITPRGYYGVEMDYNEDRKYLIKPAVNLDLGGKVPLGRHDRGKDYDLIKTVDQMLEYVNDEKEEDGKEKTEKIDKFLANILEKTCFVYGKKVLFKEYDEEVKKFLNIPIKGDETVTNGEARAIKILYDGCEEINSKGEQIKFKSDLEKFTFDAYETEGRIYDIKDDIYRLPDRLIYNLGLIYNIESEDGWGVIEALCKKQLLNEEGANNLKNALNYATILRLKAYSSYGYQKDKMNYYSRYQGIDLKQEKNKQEQELIQKAVKEIFSLTEEELKEDGPLFKYYYTTIPLTKKLQVLCNKQKEKTITQTEKINFFKDEIFYLNSTGVKAKINLRLLKMDEALKYELEELKELEHKYGKNNAKIINNYNNVGIRYEALGNYEQALEYLKKALELNKKLSLKDPTTANSYNNVGVIYISLGNYKEALEYLKNGLELNKKVLGSEHKNTIVSYSSVGSIYEAIGNYNQALKFNEKALSLYEQVLGLKHPLTANSYNNIGTTYEALGRIKEALQYHKKALSVYEEVLGLKHPNTAKSYGNLGSIYGFLGNYSKALKYYIKTLKIQEEVLGTNHPSTAMSYNSIGTIYQNLGEYKLARENFEKALRLNLKGLNLNHPSISMSYNNVGTIYIALGKYEQAKENFEKALEINERVLGFNHPSTAINYDNIGSVYIALSKPTEALKYFEKSLEMHQEVLGQGHSSTSIATCYNNIGTTYGEIGEYKKALEYQQKALNIQKEMLSHNHPTTAKSYNNIGTTYKDSGEHQEALKYLLKALKIHEKTLGLNHLDTATGYNNVGTVYG